MESHPFTSAPSRTCIPEGLISSKTVPSTITENPSPSHPSKVISLALPGKKVRLTVTMESHPEALTNSTNPEGLLMSKIVPPTTIENKSSAQTSSSIEVLTAGAKLKSIV